jgi:ATP synthase F1 delta subunit
MSKIATAYAKSLFQSVYLKYLEAKKSENLELKTKNKDDYKISLITSFDVQTAPVTINVLREEFYLIEGFFLLAKNSEKNYKNPFYNEEGKLAILFQIFPGFSNTMKSFLKVLTERKHLYLLPEISSEFEKFTTKVQDSIDLKLIIASPLPENFGANLLKILKKITNAKDIRLSVMYDPKILGGVVIEYNSVAIDASILKEFSFFFSE